MKLIDQIRSSTLGAIAAISTLCAFAAISPYLPYTRIHAQSVGPGGVPGSTSGSGGAVSSVFGRTGAVTAQSGDYSAAQVTNAAATNAANSFSADQTISTASTSGANFSITDTTGATWEFTSTGSAATHPGTLIVSRNGTQFFGVDASGNMSIAYTGNYNFAAGSDPLGLVAASFSHSSGCAGCVYLGQGNGSSSGGLILSMIEAGGTVFTVSGCGTPTATGGAFAGTFSAGASPCDAVITLPKAASHGWACNLTDLTRNAASAFFTQSGTTTTTASYSQTGTISVGDTIQFGPCESY